MFTKIFNEILEETNSLKYRKSKRQTHNDKYISGNSLIYVRVSTMKQEISPEQQLEYCLKYAEFNNYKISEDNIYLDDAKSGISLDKRNGIIDALNNLKKGDVLIVYALSRLARNVGDSLKIMSYIEYKESHFASVNEKIDTTSIIGRFVFVIFSALNEMEADQTADRTISAIKYKKSIGQHCGRIPFGYEISEESKKLIKNDKEQKIIQLIKELKAQNLSSYKIAFQLESMNIPPPNNKNSNLTNKWQPKTVQNILNRELTK